MNMKTLVILILSIIMGMILFITVSKYKTLSLTPPKIF